MTKKPWSDPAEVTDLALSWDEFRAKHPDRTYESWRSKRRSLVINASPQAEPVVDGAAAGSRNDEALPPLERSVLRALRREPYTVKQLSSQLDRSEETIAKAVEKLRQDGYEVVVDEDRVLVPKEPIPEYRQIDLTPFYHDGVKLGLVSCTHYGSKWQQPSNLKAFLEICQREKVAALVHHGDLVDGNGMFKAQWQEQFATGADDQEDAAVFWHPRAEVPQYVVGGNHDYSWVSHSGLNIVKRICARRPDLLYQGLNAIRFTVNGQVVYEVLHFRGGTAYALSYRMQRLSEALGRKDFPQILGIGGQHQVAILPSYQDICVLLLGAFQGRTPYLASKGLWPSIGGLILTTWLDGTGKVCHVWPEWYGFMEVEHDY